MHLMWKLLLLLLFLLLSLLWLLFWFLLLVLWLLLLIFFFTIHLSEPRGRFCRVVRVLVFIDRPKTRATHR